MTFEFLSLFRSFHFIHPTPPLSYHPLLFLMCLTHPFMSFQICLVSDKSFVTFILSSITECIAVFKREKIHHAIMSSKYPRSLT
mmetsp:Transcript_25226/g.34589  ORF Transcript_25226/g.34589 Transcript_25226/m.34589 type:complete len:84 (-) Transcript_25226:1244-1495(-)